MDNDHRSAWTGSTTSTTPLSPSPRSSDLDIDNPDLPPLVDEEDDALLPRVADVSRTYRDGMATWETFLEQASRIPPGLWPADALNPYITLMDVPSLLEQLPRARFLYGRPRWELPRGIGGTDCGGQDPGSSCYLALIYGRRATFWLQAENPIRCATTSDAAAYVLGAGPDTTNSLAVLVMCWSYILSARLLEMRGREVRYSTNHLWPDTRQLQGGHAVHVDLKDASPSLVRWLCAILSQEMGWRASDQGELPPWATSFQPDVKLDIAAPNPAAHIRLPRSSSEATELLIELCRLFNLGADPTAGPGLESMPPYKASFLAALALPFYECMALNPQLPSPHLTGPRGNDTPGYSYQQVIRAYMGHVRYFMTFSMDPGCIGSIIWSMLWQPDVECNLVGPWLASVLDTLEPTIKEKRVEVLLKVFLSRRPRVAIWWISLFLLGDLELLDWIQKYTTRLEEKWGYGTLLPPDLMVSAWTGSKQSFLDMDRDGIYTDPSDLVSRADLLRCRFDLKLQDSASTTLAWRPFGYIQKGQVELELWPQLETKCARRYHSFIWYIGKKPLCDYGFRKYTTQVMGNVPDDDMEMRTSTWNYEEAHQVTNIRPSRLATRNMFHFMVEDAAGGRHWANAGLSPRHEQLRWLRDWEGLATWDRPVAPVTELPKGPSWFLKEWIVGRYG